MDLLLVILLIIIIYLIITYRREYESKIDRLESHINELRKLLKQSPATQQTRQEVIQPPAPAKDLPKPEAAQPAPLTKPTPVEQHKEVITEPVFERIQQPKPAFRPPLPRPVEPQLSFFERHPDLEKFIGENLVNKVGIAILVLAIGFFVKYAIDNDWVGPVGRVGIGILSGAVLIGIAHRLRISYKAFSSVLVGGGLAVFYFTITLAYHQFHLFNQTTSFIILIVITLFAIVLSILYDKEELAVIALVGGLASPFLVSSDHANYNALFIYLIVLNAGLLVIAYFKLWRILNAAAFGLTIIVCAAVIFTLPDTNYTKGFWYCTALYLLFFAINVANNVKERKTFISSDFSILLVNTSLYFATGLYLLTAMHQEEFRGLFTAGLSALHLILSYLLFKVKKVDTNILYLLIGITLTFISLSAPIQLHGHYITMFWAAETVLLYWLYLKSGIRLKKLTSLIVWCTMLISLLMDWAQVYGSSALTLNIIGNKGFITTLMTAVSSFGLHLLIEKDDSNEIYGFRVDSRPYQYIAFILLFLSGLLEVNHQFSNRYPGTSLNVVYLMLYVPAFVCAFYHLTLREKAISISWGAGLSLLSISIAVYLLATQSFFDAQYSLLIERKFDSLHFIAHWAGAIFIGALFYQVVNLTRRYFSEQMLQTASWIIAAAIVLFLSLEFSLLTNMLFYSDRYPIDRITTIYIKTGLPVLWGLVSFALMWLGMHYKASTLRIISLTLFSITLIKLFVFDIRNIPPAGKIAAFFLLGVLLLLVSFMYQKVKKIIVRDETPPED